MLGKKLFTLDCVASIVAIGACFLPPPRSPRPPLPPYMASVRLLAIDARDTSAEPFAPTTFSAETARSFRDLWSESNLRILSSDAIATPDATLRIALLDKRAVFSSATDKGELWRVTLTVRIELVDKTGARLWLSEAPIVFARWRPAPAGPFSWQAPGVPRDVAYNLALRAGILIRYPNLLKSPPEHP